MSAKKNSFDLVLDCSITMAWCFEDESTPFTDRILEELETSKAAVPTIWQLEVANVLLNAQRNKRIDQVKISTFVDALHTLPIVVDPSSSERSLSTTYQIAGQTGLTIYDAAYLELAIREKVPIATLDKALIKAAKKLKAEVLATRHLLTKV